MLVKKQPINKYDKATLRTSHTSHIQQRHTFFLRYFPLNWYNVNLTILYSWPTYPVLVHLIQSCSNLHFRYLHIHHADLF